MKLNSISGVNCYVRDLATTAEFYEGLGLRRGKEEEGRLTFYVNWRWWSRVRAPRPRRLQARVFFEK